MPWKKDSVSIDIFMEVKSNKMKKINKILDFVDFNFTATPFYIIADVQFGENVNSFLEEINDLANALFSTNTSTQIDWFVNVPQNMDISINNKFGNIYITDHDGEVKINLSNGDLKANNLSNKLELEVNFGNVNINQIDHAKVDFSYGEFSLNEGDFLEINSKSGEMDIGVIRKMELTAKRDKYSIDHLAEIKGQSSFSYITVRNDLKYADVKMEYGELNFENITADFNNFDITSNYGDILFETQNNNSYFLEIIHNEATRLNLPLEFSSSLNKTNIKNNDVEIFKTSGTIGKSNSKKIRINITAGEFTITTK